ncbi:MAG: addiction module protein [Eubacteriaceae bacterium]|nr:addiction module protein [Eubacteriaceae bacterium]
MESVEELAKKAIAFDPEIEKNWIAESEARYDAFKRGELQAEDWDEIKKKYEC